MLSLLFFFSIFVTYLNHWAEPTTFLAKLVGLSLSSLLVILDQVGLWPAPTIGEQYDQLEKLNQWRNGLIGTHLLP